MGLFLAFGERALPPSLSTVDLTDDGLAPLMDVDMLNGDFLLPFVTVSLQGLELAHMQSGEPFEMA